jgi:hypothetical protein
MVPGASPGSIRANSSPSRPSLTRPTGKRMRPHVKHSCQTGLSAHQRLATVLSRSARPGAWREEDLGGAMNPQPTMRTATIKRAVMPRARMANAFYASVHDSLEPLSESGRVAGWRKRRSRDDVGYRTVMYRPYGHRLRGGMPRRLCDRARPDAPSTNSFSGVWSQRTARSSFFANQSTSLSLLSASSPMGSPTTRFRQNTRHNAKGRDEFCFAKSSLRQLLTITAVDSQCDGLDAEKPGF